MYLQLGLLVEMVECLVLCLASEQHCCAGIGWVVVHVIGRSVAHSYWLLSLSGGIVALECVLILD